MEAPDQDIKTKMGIAKQKKEAGDQAFKAGEVQNGTKRHPVSKRLELFPEYKLMFH